MLNAIIVAYLLTGCIKTTNAIRTNILVFEIYRTLGLLGFIVSYSLSVLFWFPSMVHIALFYKRKDSTD